MTFKLGLKDPGPASSPVSPTQNNWITSPSITSSTSVPTGTTSKAWTFRTRSTAGSRGRSPAIRRVGFTLVRNQAKQEAPLQALQSNPIVISTIARVTFYGHDQTGREVSVTGNIDVSFANFGDPQ